MSDTLLIVGTSYKLAPAGELFLVEEKLLVGDLCFETFSEKANYFFGFLQK